MLNDWVITGQQFQFKTHAHAPTINAFPQNQGVTPPWPVSELKLYPRGDIGLCRISPQKTPWRRRYGVKFDYIVITVISGVHVVMWTRSEKALETRSRISCSGRQRVYVDSSWDLSMDGSWHWSLLLWVLCWYFVLFSCPGWASLFAYLSICCGTFYWLIMIYFGFFVLRLSLLVLGCFVSK